MALFLHQAYRLDDLFPELYRLIKAERKTLKPQTPQTIIVGNLDVEAWLEEEFIARDGVLMGVQFPFLETALETFAHRRAHGLFPRSHESWFLPAGSDNREEKKAGMLQLELAILNLLSPIRNGEAAEALGADTAALGPLQKLSYAQKLARELREYLLHIPEVMAKVLRGKSVSPIAKFWKLVHRDLEAAGYASELFLLGKHPAEDGPSLFGPGSGGSALYLFGMPILSAYHIRKLCSVALTVDVHLLSLHYPGDTQEKNSFYGAVAKKYETYADFVEKTAALTETAFRARHVATVLAPWQKAWLSPGPVTEETESPVSFLGLPGAWRGAEILGDLWHQALRADTALRQDDFAVALTDPQKDFAAFEKACSARRLSAFTRSRLFERADPLVEVAALLAEAAGDGIGRDLIVRYLSNPLVQVCFNLDDEKTNLYVRALSEANGFRSDFALNLKVYNISAALERLALGLLVDPAAARDESIPGAAYVRALDSTESFAGFAECMRYLLEAAEALKPDRGAELVKRLSRILSRLQSEPTAAFTAGLNLLNEIATLMPRRNLTAQQVARIRARHVPGKPLAQGIQKQGICVSPFAAPALFKPHLTLFDFNETMDANDSDENLLPEYLKSPTRLTPNELIAMHLVQAAFNTRETLFICHSVINTETGAEQYRSLEIERFRTSLIKKKIGFSEKSTFTPTIFSPAGQPPLFNASEADIKTVKLVHASAPRDTTLTSLLLPAIPPPNTRAELAVRDLGAYLQKPFHALLQRLTTPPEDPVDFRYSEPKLAESKGSQFRFIENYLLQNLFSPDGGALAQPLLVLGAEKRRGAIEPDGFDFIYRLLSQGTNAAELEDFTAREMRRFKVAEYIFDARVTRPFSVTDGLRLERRYLPAPKIGTFHITGNAGKFLAAMEDPCLYLVTSALYDNRTRSLIEAYLAMALMRIAAGDSDENIPAGIRMQQYEITAQRDQQPPVLEITAKPRFTLDTLSVTDPEPFLAKLIVSFTSAKPVYFDAEMLKNNLGFFATKSDDEILIALKKEAEKSGSPDFLTRFYAPEFDAESVAFFNDFIRPVAATDAKPARGKKL